jgi:hypothetical protein
VLECAALSKGHLRSHAVHRNRCCLLVPGHQYQSLELLKELTGEARATHHHRQSLL